MKQYLIPVFSTVALTFDRPNFTLPIIIDVILLNNWMKAYSPHSRGDFKDQKSVYPWITYFFKKIKGHEAVIHVNRY